jgi:hypothetical protein
LIQTLWGPSPQRLHQVIVEGPLAHNEVFLQVLQSLLPGSRCLASADAVEGTARGAWMLTRWQTGLLPGNLQPTATPSLPGLDAYQAHWLDRLGKP